MPRRDRLRRTDAGSAAPLIIGFAIVIILTIGVVVDASAAFLHRQSLSSLADGASLAAADAGASGREVYAGGLDDQPLDLTAAQAREGARRYLAQVGAFRSFPGLAYDVVVTGHEVVVRISAPVDLPLTVPGGPERPRVSASSSASVDPG